jgi:perosamine synthetase
MIYLDFNNIGPTEKSYIERALNTGQISTASPFVDEFEKAMSHYFGMPCCAVNSGTSALHLALMACGIGKGDEVIVPALSFIATANVVRYCGAIPLFADVNIETWNIDLAGWLKVMKTASTKAMIPVHLYGNPCFIRKGSFIFIEDAAESIGAELGGDLTGTIGTIGCFSFNGNKTMTTGGGGLIVTDDPHLMDRIKLLSNQCKDGDEFIDIGYNYRMTGIHAAIGLAQMTRIKQFISIKRKFNSIYRNELDGLVTFQKETEGAKSSWWYTACLFPEHLDIDSIRVDLSTYGIQTRRIFKPIPSTIAYRDDKEYLNAEYIYRHGLCLPSSTVNTERDILFVCEKIKEMI